MAVYPDLENGRFLIISDFEDQKYMELFQLINVSGNAARTLNPQQGRKETGPGCLEFIAGSPDDTIVISNTAAIYWHLKRDWRNYDLLLMNIHSPQRNLAVEVVS